MCIDTENPQVYDSETLADDDEETIEDINAEINSGYINAEAAALNAMLHR